MCRLVACSHAPADLQEVGHVDSNTFVGLCCRVLFADCAGRAGPVGRLRAGVRKPRSESSEGGGKWSLTPIVQTSAKGKRVAAFLAIRQNESATALNAVLYTSEDDSPCLWLADTWTNATTADVIKSVKARFDISDAYDVNWAVPPGKVVGGVAKVPSRYTKGFVASDVMQAAVNQSPERNEIVVAFEEIGLKVADVPFERKDPLTGTIKDQEALNRYAALTTIVLSAGGQAKVAPSAAIRPDTPLIPGLVVPTPAVPRPGIGPGVLPNPLPGVPNWFQRNICWIWGAEDNCEEFFGTYGMPYWQNTPACTGKRETNNLDSVVFCSWTCTVCRQRQAVEICTNRNGVSWVQKGGYSTECSEIQGPQDQISGSGNCPSYTPRPYPGVNPPPPTTPETVWP